MTASQYHLLKPNTRVRISPSIQSLPLRTSIMILSKVRNGKYRLAKILPTNTQYYHEQSRYIGIEFYIDDHKLEPYIEYIIKEL